jgi:hypothetical protein
MTSLAAPGTGTGWTSMLVNALTGVYCMDSMKPERPPVSDTPLMERLGNGKAHCGLELWTNFGDGPRHQHCKGDTPCNRCRLLNEAAAALALAEAKIAELEKALKEALFYKAGFWYSKDDGDLQKDAARYRWLRETMPMTIGSAFSLPYPEKHDYDTFSAKIDAAVDAALHAKR